MQCLIRSSPAPSSGRGTFFLADQKMNISPIHSKGDLVGITIDTSDILKEQTCSSGSGQQNQLELFHGQTGIETLLGQNYRVKKELARQLHVAGLSMETIGRILNLRVRIIKEPKSK
jgi:hypothetical protein